MEIEITGIKIGDQNIKVPVGLSELLDGCWTTKTKIDHNSNHYHREIKDINGQMVTTLKPYQQKGVKGA